jgi:uncharacterized protein (DUF2236 family)
MVSKDVVRFASDGVLIAGGGRAILLQVADPTVAAGVARHSDFAHRPLQRLHNTLTYVYAAVLGTPDDVARVAGFVNRAHTPVAGAEDVALQLWVAATLYERAVLVHDRVFGDVPDALADEAYREYAVLGTALQMPESAWPADRAAFREYWSGQLAKLEVTDDARQIAHDLFAPVVAPRWLRAVLPLARLLTLDLLPASIRDAYGFDWTPREQRRADRAWGVIRVLVRITPHRLRSTPARRYLRRLRRFVTIPQAQAGGPVTK